MTQAAAQTVDNYKRQALLQSLTAEYLDMFASMDDASAIGGPMALAMLTTLYGIIVANLIALPIARRLERLSAHELAWQRRALDHLETLAVTELEAKPLPVPKLRIAQ